MTVQKRKVMRFHEPKVIASTLVNNHWVVSFHNKEGKLEVIIFDRYYNKKAQYESTVMAIRHANEMKSVHLVDSVLGLNEEVIENAS